MAVDFDNVLKAGTTLKAGTYVIRRVLGQGGFGITYEAEQVLLGKRVALKECFLNGVCDRDDDGKKVFVLRSSREFFNKQKKRFLNEARRLAQLRNSHIVPVYDLFEENDTAYYVMDFVEGESLSDLLKRSGKPLKEKKVIDILNQMLDALATIHHQTPPLCHLDIKPANIMIEKGGLVMLIDFGASKYVATADESRSSSSSVAYTPGYAPIEQLAGIREDMGPWTDFYALGATLFNLLTNQKPANPSVINDDHTPDKSSSIPMPSSVSSQMRQLVVWMMNPSKNDRPKTEGEIRAFLNNVGVVERRHSARKHVAARFDDVSKEETIVKKEVVLGDNDDEIVEVEVISEKPAVEMQPDIVPISVKGVSFNMVRVKGGTFMMGASSEQSNDAYNEEKPVHLVSLSDFYIGETEVTQELWEIVMGENPSQFKGDNKRPVERVTWHLCQEFVKKLNAMTGKQFHLPTEAEWEFAARGGNKSRSCKYAGGDAIDEVAWYSDNSESTTHPVGQKKPNELGLYDMSGNVLEWCYDWYGKYRSSDQKDPKGPNYGSEHVLRGGCWRYNPEYCRVSTRFHCSPNYQNYYLGLRLAL